VKYICYENGIKDYTKSEIFQLYLSEINKLEYTNFECWLADMLKMGILVESVE